MSAASSAKLAETLGPLAVDLPLPPTDIVTEKVAFIGRTGQGKSYGAQKLAELMLEAGAQIVVLDPTSVWYGLRVGIDPPLPIYVFGGPKGELPLEPSAGALMADLIVDRGISAVLDVGEWLPSEQQRFAQEFGARFFHRKKQSRSAVHLFIEECQEFIPENPSGKLEQDTLHVFQRMLKLGRNFGIGASLISQRPQEVAKKALNQSGTLFVFQLTGPQERDAVVKYLKTEGLDGGDVNAVLPTLTKGRPHVWSPTFLCVSKVVQILPKRTADVSSTPRLGQRIARRDLSPMDLSKIKADVAASIERAKADDPKELKKQIATLERDLAAAKKAAPAAEPQRVEVPVLTPEQESALFAAAGALEEVGGQLAAITKAFTEDLPHAREAFGHAQRLLEGVRDGVASTMRAAASPTPHLARTVPVPPTGNSVAAEPRPIPKPAAENDARQAISDVRVKLLRSLSWWRAAGIETPTRLQVAAVAGYTVSGHFKNEIGGLRTAGLVVYPANGHVQLTEEGVATAPPVDSAPTRRELIEMARHVLRSSGPALKIFDAVVTAERPLSREDLATAAGYTVNGHFKNEVGGLRSLGFVHYPSNGQVALGAMFEALP